MSEMRPNPEKLLQQAQEEERQEQKGKLKIYLGAAPGVGKTYSMLQDALAQRAQGLDVVVGVVESHGRKEVEALLKNLEVLPRQNIDYHGKQITEFDLDEAIKRNPGLILIDEMAHTNVPGVRHTKRWQDIKELLDRGIDVCTTLNVQHIESLNDVVSQIVHSRIKETVPDTMLEMATTIELVDLPPEDLLKRLQEGKVYFAEQAKLAKDHFFRKGNLIALRELALRMTAERVGAQVLLYRQGQGIKHVWPTKEKILVYVGPGTESIKLIRTARRTATNLKAEWIAVYVESPQLKISEEEHNNAMHNLRLAEQLGARTRILTGFDIVKAVMDFAREQNITQIIIWKKIRPRWQEILFSDLAEKIVRNSGEIDVYLVTGTTDSLNIIKKPTSPPAYSLSAYALATGIVVSITLINFFLSMYLRSSNLIMFYLLGVTFIALLGKIGPSVFASLLSVFAFAFFFTQPYYTLAITDIPNIITLIIMLLVTSVISYLAVLTHRQIEVARNAEHHTATLHLLSQQLASTRGIDKLLTTAVRYISEVFDSDVIVLLPENNQLIIRASTKPTPVLSAKEQGVAQWVYNLGQNAGLGTDTLPFSNALYLPLLASQGPIGVLSLQPLQTKHLFTTEQIHLLEACANQIAMAAEVDRLQEQKKKTELQTEADRVRTALLQSVSHDLSTPLVSIMGSGSTLLEMSDQLDSRALTKLGNEIYLEAEQLSRLLNNLLEIFYLESTSVKLQKKLDSLPDIIHTVLNLSTKKLGKKRVELIIEPDLPAVPVDSTLLQEVFINLIDNAIKFTPPDTAIVISVKQDKEKNRILVSVEDQGPGIVLDEVNKLFEKFYRGRMLTTERGLGLDLAICRIVIEAHGGTIWAENRKEGGAAFRFTLPL